MQKAESMVDKGGVDNLKLGKIHFAGAGTGMIKKLAKMHNVSQPAELLELAQDLGVRLHPCTTTMELYGLQKDDFIEGCQPPLGAASFIDMAMESDVTFFI